jgi:hypothetical protein
LGSTVVSAILAYTLSFYMGLGNGKARREAGLDLPFIAKALHCYALHPGAAERS